MTVAEPAYAVVPYNSWPAFGIANMSLDKLHWPLGRPTHLLKGTVRDLGPQDHLIAYPNSELFYTPWFGIRAKVSVMIVEPDAVHEKNLKRAYRFRKSFNAVLTKSDKLLTQLENGLFFYFGSTFIEDIDAIRPHKTRHMSLIASGKRDMEGHKLRHDMVDFVRANNLDVDVMGRGYNPFKHKEEGLQSYRYSVVIENVREPHYFTEKLVDAALCGTVPIYWGCPNIAEYLNPDGMIICTNAEQLQNAIRHASEADFETRREAIAQNVQRARFHADYLHRAAQTVKEMRPCLFA